MWEEIRNGPSVQGDCAVLSGRLKVPGGWLVRTIVSRYKSGADVEQTFVADAGHEWKLEVGEE
ncbi:hypothetical protein HN643_04585 [Candidatus Falkowbacteria bacterium]|jgi:hypothetical protein|nr:hypothetical protein [Candidatus Falkowbacteria bacterium]MBT5503282.1 hypothetical protein [Candidatus Falkowbacteria bacterium]MBT6574509.1 hypothetical protein [Candidatus Falkowbacteria bacterium]MBT7500917.1 hypothetical protein [Candidatus Falkowbacteria bacterium]